MNAIIGKYAFHRYLMWIQVRLEIWFDFLNFRYSFLFCFLVWDFLKNIILGSYVLNFINKFENYYIDILKSGLWDSKMVEKINEYIYMAKLAEQMERYEDMTEYMKKIIELSKDLKDEERNLLSIAYKNAVGQRRTAWRAIYAYEMKEKTKVSKFYFKFF